MHLETLIKQKPYEHPVYELRRHPFIFLKIILIFALLAGLPVLLFFAINAAFPGLLTSATWFPFLLFAASVYYLSIWLFFLTEFTDYYLDVWIVTNDRVVNTEQHGLFGRTVAELDLYKIQDVTSDVRGMLATFLNYGNVHVQTAGQKERFVFEEVPNPHEIRKRIIDLIETDRKYHVKDAIIEKPGLL